ncbi:MAG: N-acetylmuramoyl-L-alanine amidase, partial [Bacteroidales bacterium]|nr:N-acetylmuramoyl-L-alanine amidase [Bacteroidales bacterium]
MILLAWSLKTVVIDPGHGGKDPGCISRDGKTYEKTITLDISKRFAEKISSEYPDVKVI